MVLGYALHCTAFAAAGSLITRESDAANVTFPVSLPLLFAYALSFGIIFGGSSNGLFPVLAYIPPTARHRLHHAVRDRQHRARPGGGVGRHLPHRHGATARLAATIYERSILRTGARSGCAKRSPE